jgi:hypothetical protein
MKQRLAILLLLLWTAACEFRCNYESHRSAKAAVEFQR